MYSEVKCPNPGICISFYEKMRGYLVHVFYLIMVNMLQRFPCLIVYIHVSLQNAFYQVNQALHKYTLVTVFHNISKSITDSKQKHSTCASLFTIKHICFSNRSPVFKFCFLLSSVFILFLENGKPFTKRS